MKSFREPEEELIKAIETKLAIALARRDILFSEIKAWCRTCYVFKLNPLGKLRVCEVRFQKDVYKKSTMHKGPALIILYNPDYMEIRIHVIAKGFVGEGDWGYWHTEDKR